MTAAAVLPEASQPPARSADPSQDLVIALLTPTGSDGSVAAQVLTSAGLAVKNCDSIDDVCTLIASDEAGVVVIAEEALNPFSRVKLFESLNRQPSWSDVPIILLTGEGELSNALPRALSGVAIKGNVTLLERPVRVATLTTVIRSAQRARQRQLDVRELVESERAARRQAEEANSAKSQFLATMSHELRTPLNAIAGYTQLLALGVRGPVTEEQKADLDRIARSQRHLLSLINDILNFAKIEAGHVDVETGPVDLCHILDNVDELIQPQLTEKNLQLTVRHDAEDAIAAGDSDKVRQILLNLLSNAIKFTQPGGRIDVLCTATASEISVTVRDNGVGIPADKVEAIFEPFVQVGRDFTTPHAGTGLGLSISRDLARRMGGDLSVDSRLGEMSAFTLTLKRMRPASTA